MIDKQSNTSEGIERAQKVPSKKSTGNNKKSKKQEQTQPRAQTRTNG